MLNSAQGLSFFKRLAIFGAMLVCCPSIWADADLQAVALSSLSPNSVAPGSHPQSVTFTFANNGPGLYDAITYELYLSPNTNFGDSDDLKIGEYDDQFWPAYLYPGLFEDCTLSTAEASGMTWFTIPPNTPAGNYYVILRVLPATYSSQTDPNLSNNVVCSTSTVSVAIPGCGYAITPARSYVPASGGTVDASVFTSNSLCGWAVTAPSWIAADPSSSSGWSGWVPLRLTISPNDSCLSRTGIVTVAGETFTVLQAGGPGLFAVSSKSWYAPSSDAQTNLVSVTAGPDCAWSVINPEPSWVAVTPLAGIGDGVVTISLATNTGSTLRSCTLTIAGKSFTIDQDAAWCRLTLSATNWTARSIGGSTNITVSATRSDCTWTVVNTACDWVSVSPTAGTGNGTVKISVDPFLAEACSPRTCTITVAGQNFSVTQSSPAVRFSVVPVLCTLPQQGGSNSFMVYAADCFSWTVQNSCPWLTVTPTNGAGRDFVTVSALANSANTGRCATIVVGGQSVTVNQAGPLPGVLTLVTPHEGESLNRGGLKLSWTEPGLGSPAAWYRLCIMKSVSKYLDTWIQTNQFQSPDVFAAGSYTWYVQGWNSAGLGPWSRAGHFTLQSGAPSAPQLVFPKNETNNQPTISYAWHNNADATWYELCIVKDGAIFVDKWIPGCSASGTVCIESISGHTGGQYTWWVRGWNPDGMGAWSAAAAFHVHLSVPTAANLLSPSDGYTYSAGQALTFNWYELSSAQWYCLDLDRNGSNYLSLWMQPTNDFILAYHLTNSLPAGTYTWKVAGWNSSGMGEWSTNRSFTVAGNGDPMSPIGIVPSGPNECYRWHTDANSSSYELYITKDGALFRDQWITRDDLTLDFGTSAIFCCYGHSPGNYTWCVRSFSPVTGTNAWSTTATFMMQP